MTAVGHSGAITAALEPIISVAQQLTGARCAALGVLGSNGNYTIWVQTGSAPDAADFSGGPSIDVGLFEQLANAADRSESSLFGIPLRLTGTAGSQLLGHLILTDAGQPISAETANLLDGLAQVAVAAIENAARYEESQRQSRWLSAATEVGTALLAGEEDALELIAKRAVNIVQAHCSALILQGLNGEWVLEVAHGDPIVNSLIGLVVPENTKAGLVIESGMGLCLADCTDDYVFHLPPMTALGPALYAPLASRDGAIGVLILFRKRSAEPFVAADLAAAQEFGRTAALAVQLAAARVRQEQADLADERARIARDLHDLVVQELCALGISLNRLRRDVPATTARQLDVSIDVLDRTIREIRTTIRLLRDPDETTLAVGERLRTEVNAAAQRLGFSPRLEGTALQDLTLDLRLTANQADDIVAVVREGLSNAARHARADDIMVRLVDEDEEISVTIVDNGIGLPQRVLWSSGLTNLAERARRSGGHFETSNAEVGTGTRIHWKIPLASTETDQ